MRRSTLDALLSIAGAVVTAVLLVAGGLLLWAGNFANGTVAQQLADQRITMPAGAAIADPQIKPYLEQYAGQPMTTGAQAQAYADHYIKVHMNASSQGKTYGEVSVRVQRDGQGPERRPGRCQDRSGTCVRPSSWVTRCGACCSTPTRSALSAPSPSTRPSPQASVRRHGCADPARLAPPASGSRRAGGPPRGSPARPCSGLSVTDGPSRRPRPPVGAFSGVGSGIPSQPAGFGS